MTSPKVIGFIPAYNSAKFIKKTLAALAVQNYSNFEIWICDDKSTDDTTKICAEFCEKDKRFKLLKNESNLGWWKTSLNLWHQVSSKSEYCFFQPHDDIPSPDFIIAQVELLEQNSSAVLCVPGIKNTYPDGKSRSFVLSNLGTSALPSQRIIPLVNWEVENWWAAVHGMHRSKFISKIIPVDYLRFGEKEFALDLIWLIKLASWGPFICSDKVLFEKFYSEKSLSGAWKYNFVNRSAVYLAMAETTMSLAISPIEKSKILLAITKKSFGSIARKIGLSK